MAPDIKSLPKNLWDTQILPEMAARLGIKEKGYDKYKGMSFEEMEVIFTSGSYANSPVISQEDWTLLRGYIMSMAPDSLTNTVIADNVQITDQFESHIVNVDHNPGTFITYLNYNEPQVVIGELNGAIHNFDYSNNSFQLLDSIDTAVTGFEQIGGTSYITGIGILEPSDLSRGVMYKSFSESNLKILDSLHRPVHSIIRDLNVDGSKEIVVSEFGHQTGELSLFKRMNEQYIKQTLVNLPGIIKTEIHDLNNDGLLDIIALSSQGDEGVLVFYQQKDLQFSMNRLIRYSPVYGTSWFEMVDYNNDGFLDIVTVQGDNADKTYVQKPYHGLRIHLNDGSNNFTESYFYPLNGATRFAIEDFDKDNDYDLALISTFPDYDNHPELSFVYLENIGGNVTFEFNTEIIKEANEGRWLLMDKGDVDQDGDTDIILSSFSYSFTPVPQNLEKQWQENNVDLLILENQLIN
ncbi:hypothetical protein KH5_03390 [Urechidicola sp. KH5]